MRLTNEEQVEQGKVNNDPLALGILIRNSLEMEQVRC